MTAKEILNKTRIAIKEQARAHPWRTGSIAAVIVLLLLAGFGFFKPRSEEAPTQTTTVTRETIIKTVSTTGRVVPNFEVEIKAKASGKIIRLPFDVSDAVKEGDLLIQLDPIDESRQVSQAQASLAGLENRTGQARLNFSVAKNTLTTDLARARADLRAAEIKAKNEQSREQRLSTLVQKRYISQEEYETGLSTSSQAGSDLENARIRLQELQTQQLAVQAQAKEVGMSAADTQAQRVALAIAHQRLDETKIYSPIEGVVTSRTGQIGQIVSSGISNVGGGTAMMTIADLSRIFVLAAVDESDIGQIREGQFVTITADSFPGEKFRGRVTRISPKGVVTTNVVTFEVKILVLGKNSALLKPEMTTNIDIHIARKANVLTVPSEAIVTQSGKTFVHIPKGGNKNELKAVSVGINNGTRTEITHGLKEGDTVVVGQNQVQSRWRKDGESPDRQRQRGQRMMMRNFGGGG